MDEEGFGELEDPVDEEGFGELEDPVDEEGFGELEDPAGILRRRRYRRRKRWRCRRRARGTGALCGDYPSGRGNFPRTAPALSGRIVVRLTAQYALTPGLSLEDLADEAGLDGLRSVLEKYELTEKSRRLVARRGSTEAHPTEESPPVGEESPPVGEESPPVGVESPTVGEILVKKVRGWYGEDGSGGGEGGSSGSGEGGDDLVPEPEVVPFSAEPREVTPEEIVSLERTVANSPMAPLHSLATYWRLDANHKSDKLKKILKRLNKLAEVSLAYPEVAATDPGGGTGDPFAGTQGYLDKAPFGIDAHWARRHDGDGNGIALADLEQGWIPDHPDLDAATPTLIHGNNRNGKDDWVGNHGTAVLGEIVAGDNGFGVLGIAPGVAKVGLLSHYHDEPEVESSPPIVDTSDSHVAEAIYAAIGHLPPESPGVEHEPFLKAGDVLLIEAQRAYLPTEMDPADFDAIRLASALGIIVVEAAGNGGRNLDAYRRPVAYRGKKSLKRKGPRIFNRRSSSYRESGAIMVGAALGPLPHNRKSASNYGSRIDCYAWGTGVVTCGYGDLAAGGTNGAYTADFSNTSAAAPIIAGAALIVQSMYRKAAGDVLLSPGQMRALLADPATGTPQGRGVGGHIGVMPNLRAIVENTLGIVPDVYLRDSIGDTGRVPAARSCRSPDVFVTQHAGNFGEDTPAANDPGLGYKVMPGGDNRLYVRMRNRGRLATTVTPTIYHSPAATLVTPDRWTEIGHCDSIPVPQGDTLVVTQPLQWHQRRIPAPGFYCLIALLEDADDPTRLPPGLLAAEGARARARKTAQAFEPPRFNWRRYLTFLRNHNHVAFRNLHVVDDLQPGLGINRQLEFLVTGTPAGDRARFFDLEVLQQLPASARLCLDVPLTLAPALNTGNLGEPQILVESPMTYLRYDLPPLPRFPFCRVPLAAGAEHPCRFAVRDYPAGGPSGHEIAIRQLFGGFEVGRVTFLLRPD